MITNINEYKKHLENAAPERLLHMIKVGTKFRLKEPVTLHRSIGTSRGMSGGEMHYDFDGMSVEPEFVATGPGVMGKEYTDAYWPAMTELKKRFKMPVMVVIKHNDKSTLIAFDENGYTGPSNRYVRGDDGFGDWEEIKGMPKPDYKIGDEFRINKKDNPKIELVSDVNESKEQKGSWKPGTRIIDKSNGEKGALITSTTKGPDGKIDNTFKWFVIKFDDGNTKKIQQEFSEQNGWRLQKIYPWQENKK